MANEYDVVVIGSGTGGYVAAIRAAQLGLRTAVVERAPVLGGTCLNWGCIPTKALLEHAHALKIAQDWKEWGLTIGEAAIGIDMAQVQARKDKIVKGLTGGVELLFKKNKIDWIKGSGRLAGKGKVEITDGAERRRSPRRKEIIVATGSQPRSVPGHRDRSQADHHQRRSDRPEGRSRSRSSIMGSGAVGVEFASIFRRFGSEVTIIELLPRLVPVEDEAVSAELERSFKKQGIKVLTGTKVTSAKAGADGVDLEAQTADGKTTRLKAEYLLVATGRGPVTIGLGAEEAGLRMERGYIRVDDRFRDQRAGHLGDRRRHHLREARPPAAGAPVVGRGHRARRADRRAASSAPINYDQVPGCTYCDPEIGSVGLTEKEAQARGYDVKTGSFKFGILARARIAGETEGFVKIVFDKKYDEILGVHMIGPRVDRAGRRSDAGAAPRVHGRRADPHHPRAPDDVGSGRRGRARGARRRRYMRSELSSRVPGFSGSRSGSRFQWFASRAPARLNPGT